MRPLRAFGVALGVCAIASTCILYVTKSIAQSVKESPAQAESNASPIYGVTMAWPSAQARRAKVRGIGYGVPSNFELNFGRHLPALAQADDDNKHTQPA
jgi:hypothetical protein